MVGVCYDVRKAHPYLIYDRLDWDVPVGHKGDNFDRYLCRMEEIFQSSRIIDQCFEQIPDGPINIVECVRRPETCEASDCCEARDLYARLNQRISGLFESISLAELAASHPCEEDEVLPL